MIFNLFKSKNTLLMQAQIDALKYTLSIATDIQLRTNNRITALEKRIADVQAVNFYLQKDIRQIKELMERPFDE